MVHRERKRVVPPLCPNCGYDLRGATSDRCSECGEVFYLRDLESQEAEHLAKLHEAEGVNELLGIGFKFIVGGAALLLLGIVLGGAGGLAICLGRVIAFGCAVAGLSLGFSVFRFLRLPEDLRNRVTHKPDLRLAVIDIGLGLVMLATCMFLPG